MRKKISDLMEIKYKSVKQEETSKCCVKINECDKTKSDHCFIGVNSCYEKSKRKKSHLEQLKDIQIFAYPANIFLASDLVYSKESVDLLLRLYELAIKEIQGKQKYKQY